MSELLNVQQLAAFLNTTENTVRGLTRTRSKRSGQPVIPHVKIGKRVYFRREGVLRWLEAREVTQ